MTESEKLVIAKNRFCKNWSLHCTKSNGYDRVLATAKQKYVLEAITKNEKVLYALLSEGTPPLYLD